MENLTQVQSIVIFAWWIALSFSVVIYVVLDGADLGAGVFSLFVRNADERGAIMAAMAGTWDANETWLIVAGGVLFATFPFVYGSAFSYLLVLTARTHATVARTLLRPPEDPLAQAKDLLRRPGPLPSFIGRTDRPSSPTHEGPAHGWGQEPTVRTR